ncbi:CoA transferase [Micrococcus endophyticus]|uniref:CoA transferase n=1 Tax=Micrococcus endophyticus TaxID=455343 RepID=UPI003B8A76B7
MLLGHRPGSLDRFGLDPEALARRHPHLVVGSLSAWGEAGPWAHRAGFDSIVQAACGIADACGRDGEPGALPVQALDHATGHRLFAETVRLMAAGRAGVVRISLLGAARTLQGLAPPPPGPAAELPVPRVQVGSEAGRLHAVPPAIALDGEVLARDVGAYGAAALRWL